MVAGASFIFDLSHDYVLPHINKNQKLTNIESALLQIGTSGAATAEILVYGSQAPNSAIPIAFLTGAASAMAGDYITSKFILGNSNLLF